MPLTALAGFDANVAEFPARYAQHSAGSCYRQLSRSAEIACAMLGKFVLARMVISA